MTKSLKFSYIFSRTDTFGAIINVFSVVLDYATKETSFRVNFLIKLFNEFELKLAKTRLLKNVN